MREHASWREAPPPFDASRFEESVLGRARQGWQKLYADEQDSVVAAGLVLADLARLSAPHALLARAARLIEDEVRHVRVCGHVLAALGATPAQVDPAQTRQLPPGSVAERQAKLLIQGFVVGESMSAASFQQAREHCGEPIARWAYTELLRDEARHGVFGADAGKWVLEMLPSGFAQELWPGCVAEMQAMEQRVGGPFDEPALARESAIRDVEQLEMLGLLRGSRSCHAYHRAIERWVIPRLRDLDVVVAAA